MPVTLRLYSDFVCPFCFVAEQSTVPRLRDEFDLVVDWRGFPLHPRTPKGGMPLTALFPASRVPAVKEHLRQFAARFGVTEIAHPDRLPNTRRVLAMAEYARENGRLDEFRRAGLEAHDPRYQAEVDKKLEEAQQHGVTGIPTFFIGGEQVVGCS